MDNDLYHKFIEPGQSLSDFVEGFWLLQNKSEHCKKAIVLPDGRIDLILSQPLSEQFKIYFLGIGTQPDQTVIPPKSSMFAISFKPLAAEYLFQFPVADILDNGKNLPSNFWHFSNNDLNDFETFYTKAIQKIQSLLPKEIDERKRKLFELIYQMNGEISIKELSEKVFWNSRSINRYFNQQFGLSLKTYCSILRFYASFQHLKDGKLFPQQNYSDQAHFIREVKRLSGVSPKKLFKNENDRFIQFSILSSK